MSSLKKWRRSLGDVSTPIYCAPGLFEYTREIARPYTVEWASQPDYDELGPCGAVAGIGPCRLPADNFLLVDGPLGYGMSVSPVEGGGQEVTISTVVEFGQMTSPVNSVVHVLPSGRVHKASYSGDFESIRANPARQEDARALWIRGAATAIVFSQVVRRHRTRIECVSTGNPRNGTASYRGDVYVVRDFSEVLRHYRELDDQESAKAGGKKRWHMRAGHFVLLNTPKEYWRNPCEAGDERLGRVVKDYSLPKYQPRERTA